MLNQIFPFSCTFSSKKKPQAKSFSHMCHRFLHYCNGTVYCFGINVMSNSLIHEISRCKYIINYESLWWYLWDSKKLFFHRKYLALREFRYFTVLWIFRPFMRRKKVSKSLNIYINKIGKKNRTESIVKRTKTKMLIKFIPQKQI